MKTATFENLRSWNPCYDEARLAQLEAEHPSATFTAIDVLERSDLPAADRLWVVLRPEMLDDRTLRLFAADCAERACTAAGWDDPRSLNAIAVARRFANGEATAAELQAARAAAYADAAAYAADAAAYAADAAAADAAAYAADAAAADAARAAYAAAYAAARAAAAERETQVERLLTLIQEAP